VLENVPQGDTHTVVILTETDYFFEDDWLTIPMDEELEVLELGDLWVSVD
jgi:hypothetical protein